MYQISRAPERVKSNYQLELAVSKEVNSLRNAGERDLDVSFQSGSRKLCAGLPFAEAPIKS